MSIESVMPANHLILYRPLLFLPSVFPSIRVFSNESALCIRWPKYCSFSFSINPSNEYSGLISFRMYWLDLLAVQGTLKSLLQHPSSKASILWHSAFFYGPVLTFMEKGMANHFSILALRSTWTVWKGRSGWSSKAAVESLKMKIANPLPESIRYPWCWKQFWCSERWGGATAGLELVQGWVGGANPGTAKKYRYMFWNLFCKRVAKNKNKKKKHWGSGWWGKWDHIKFVCFFVEKHGSLMDIRFLYKHPIFIPSVLRIFFQNQHL